MATPSKRLQGQLRKERSRSGAAKTFAEAFVRGLKAVHALSTGGTYVWPAPEFYDDPVGYCSKVLGVQLWGKQIEIANALCNGTRVAVRSGRKVGKTALAACLALWFFCTRADAQVLLSASTMKQVERVVWRELRMRYERALHPLGGELNLSPLSGLKDGFRSIVGFSNRNREAAAGVSGVALLYVIDEASGVEDSIFSSIDGNLAGGSDCKILLLSNPTRNEGYFADIFLNKRTAALWQAFTISSKESPNCVAGKVVVPGLATLEWVEWQANRYGEDSAEFIVHVLGEHALGEDGRAIPLSMVSAAIARHDPTDYDRTPTLYIGLDPAGDTLKGDLTSVTARRGFHHLGTFTGRGLNVEGVVALVAQVADQFRNTPDEPVIVNYDEGGEVGAKLLPSLRETASRNRWKLNRFRSSDKSVRFKANTERKSAELVWNFREWLRQGGSLIEDDFLTQEIRAWEFVRVKPDSEKVKVNKDAVRKLIKRSPDRFDSLALAVWDSWEDVHSSDTPKVQPSKKTAVSPYATKDRPQRNRLSPFGSRH